MVESHPPCNLVERTFRQLHEIILHKRFRQLDQFHAARESTVVPPVGIQPRHGIGTPRIVDLNHQAVVAVVERIGYLKVESSKAAGMLAQLLAVQPHLAVIVRRPKINKHPRISALVIRKISLIPQRILIEHQRLALRVPVARDFQRPRDVEVVFDQIALVFGLSVFIELRPQACFIGIDNRVPGSIQ